MTITWPRVALVAVVAGTLVALAALKQLPGEAAAAACGALVGLLVPSQWGKR